MPSAIQYVTGDATAPEASGSKIIVHVCNDVGGWGAGFVLAISRRWSEPESDYRDWYAERASNDFGLGAVRLVKVESDLYVANLIGQQGLRRTAGRPPIRYDAIGVGLARVAEHALTLRASVHMPRIRSLAGGRWEEIEPLVLQHLTERGVPVTVYDLA